MGSWVHVVIPLMNNKLCSKQLDFRAPGVYTLVHEDASDENNNAENSRAKSILVSEETDHTPSMIQCANKRLDLSTPAVMGILNLTPDSFYDGGNYNTTDKALMHVEAMLSEGADIIDIGAESSRPDARGLSLQEEMDRIMTTLVSLKMRFDTLFSVDTYKPLVMKEAIKMGVNMINDIYALRQEGAVDVIRESRVAVCLMHMQGTPNDMQNNPSYVDPISELSLFFKDRTQHCLEAGIAKNRILIDPGFGFGKTTLHNISLLKNLMQFRQLGFPLLVGLSRKTSIGEILSLPPSARLYGSLAAHVIAILQGASVIRTHDVKPTVEALKITTAILRQETVA
jgi:dihydropteroate synthase